MFDLFSIIFTFNISKPSETLIVLIVKLTGSNPNQIRSDNHLIQVDKPQP